MANGEILLPRGTRASQSNAESIYVNRFVQQLGGLSLEARAACEIWGFSGKEGLKENEKIGSQRRSPCLEFSFSSPAY